MKCQVQQLTWSRSSTKCSLCFFSSLLRMYGNHRKFSYLDLLTAGWATFTWPQPVVTNWWVKPKMTVRFPSLSSMARNPLRQLHEYAFSKGWWLISFPWELCLSILPSRGEVPFVGIVGLTIDVLRWASLNPCAHSLGPHHSGSWELLLIP